MDPITLIVTALTLGAAAGLKPVAEQAVKDAYSGFKRLIIDRYQAVQTGIQLIEKNPESEAFQETTKELLRTTAVVEDTEVLQQAKNLVQTVEKLAPETSGEINLKLEDIKAVSDFRIADLEASGTGARIDIDVKKVEAGKDFEIKGLRAGGGEQPTKN